MHDGAVVIKPGLSNAGIFLLHDDAGSVDYAQRIAAHCDARWTIYGLPASPYTLPRQTLEGRAHDLLQALRRTQPEGPYRLAGWGAGGVLAYEIAAQLLGADQSVAFVGLLAAPYARGLTDAAAPVPFTAAMSDLRDAAQRYHAYALPIPVHIGGLENGGAKASVAETGGAERSGSGPASWNGWDRVQPQTRLRRIDLQGLSGIHDDAAAKRAATALQSALAQSAEDAVRPRGMLFELQSANRGRTPLICVPGAGASSTSFLELIGALGEQHSIYGLEPRGLDGGEVPHATVEAAAASHVTLLLDELGLSPLHLLGHSHGGLIALQMALELQTRGRPPASLTIVDSRALDAGEQSVDVDDAYILQRLLSLYAQSAGKPLHLNGEILAALSGAARRAALHQAMVAAGLLPPRSNPQLLEGPLQSFARCVRTAYTPTTTYEGELRFALLGDPTLDLAENRRRDIRKMQSWRRHAPRAVFWNAPGTHMSGLKNPHVRALADWWRSGAVA